MSTQNTPSFVSVAAQSISLSDDVKAKYSGAGGAGDDAFEYRRGSGASAVSFVFACNAAYGENSPLSRAQVYSAQLGCVETKLWPGKTRGGVEPALACMFGRGQIAHVAGGYQLSERGLSLAKAMFADMGIAWPTDGQSEKPKGSKPRANRKAKAVSEAPAETTEAPEGQQGAETSVEQPVEQTAEVVTQGEPIQF